MRLSHYGASVSIHTYKETLRGAGLSGISSTDINFCPELMSTHFGHWQLCLSHT